MIETFNAFQLTRRRKDLAKARSARLQAAAALNNVREKAEHLELTLRVTAWKIQDIRAQIKRLRQEVPNG